MSRCYGCLTIASYLATPRQSGQRKRSHRHSLCDGLAIAEHLLHKPRLFAPKLEWGMAARHARRQFQDSAGSPAYQPEHAEAVEKSRSSISAYPFRAIVSVLSLQLLFASGIALSIERSALSATRLAGSPMGFGLPLFILLA
jgi:hypothetical protein